jgi:hypothetical protein
MTEPNRPRTEATPGTHQIACRSCGYRRAWLTMLEAVADGHRHHAEHASREPPAWVTPVPAMRDTTGHGRRDPNA